MTNEELIEKIKEGKVKILDVEVKEVSLDGQDIDVTFARSKHKRNKPGFANKLGALVIFPDDYDNNESKSKKKRRH